MRMLCHASSDPARIRGRGWAMRLCPSTNAMQALTPTIRASRAAALAPGHAARPRTHKQQTINAARSAISKWADSISPMAQRALAARPASKPSRRRTAVTAAAAGSEALVVGSSGQTAARIVVNLLRNGFKVTAGVDTDVDETREVVKFAKQLEILSAGEASSLKLAEFNPLDAEDLGSAIKKGARVVLVVGDQAGSRRPDLRVYDAVLDALLENSGKIGQLVVVTPLGSPVGTGFFGGNRGRTGSSRLSPLEQRVVDSGVPYLLVRAAPADRVNDRYGAEANVVVKGFGGLPTGLAASRAQVAATVAAAMAKVRGDAILEVGASSDAAYVDLASQIAEALSGAQEEEEEEEEEEPAPAKKPAFFTIGSRKKAAPVVVEEEEEEEEEEPPAPAKKPGFFTIGSRKKPAPVVVEEEEEEEEQQEETPAPAKKPAFSFFGGSSGTRKIVRQPEPVQEQEEEEEEEEEEQPPAKPARRGFSFGTVRVSKQQKAAEEQEEEAEAEAPPKKAGAFRFAASSSRTSSQQQEEAPAPAAPAPAAGTRRIIRGRNPIPAEPEKPAPKPAAQPQPAAEEGEQEGKKKSGGFLGLLGISQETVYADEV